MSSATELAVGSADEAPARFRAPTIKGIFVNSHLQMVRRLRGDTGMKELEARMGMPLRFRATDDVPVRDEVRLIEHALDLTSETPLTGKARAFEAGRLHFRNFTTTPWAKVLFTIFPRNFKFMTLHAKTVAERVFNGVGFHSEDLGSNTVRVTMENADYPIEHFRGLFQEWMNYFGYDGVVEAKTLGGRHFQYTMHWL